MGTVESSWPNRLRWPVRSAWEAEKLAKVVMGIETRGITTDKAAHIIARKLFAHHLSYSPVNVPSARRPENFIHDGREAIAAGNPLVLTPNDSKKAYETLLVITSPNVQEINGNLPAIEVNEANLLLEGIRPIVVDRRRADEEALREEAELALSQSGAIAAAN